MNWPQFIFGGWLLLAALTLCACIGGGEAYQPSPALEESQS